jgi:anti-sigma factor (TIGR02949 family)
MDCRKICDLLTAYLDGEVTPEEKANIEAHLAGCPRCQSELGSLSAVQNDLRGRCGLPRTRAYLRRKRGRR